MSENHWEKKQKEDAQIERNAGKDAFMKGEYDAAVKRFSKAIELDDEDVLIVTDRVLAYYQMQKFKECIADCIRAEELTPKSIDYVELRASLLTTKGLAYQALAKCAKDYDLAIEALDEACKLSVSEARCHELDGTRRLKELFEKRESLGDWKRETGNKVYMKKEFDGAIKYYTEAIELNPCDTKAYCNRALCYTLKEMLAEGLKDAEKSLELDPKFVRGYIRKGNIEFQKREYSKALETYEMGLEQDKNNKELCDAISKCHKEMAPAGNTGTIMQLHEASREKQANALLDPEIQAILSDPIMRQVLIDFQQNSSDAHDLAKNKLVLQKVQKLLDANLL